MIRQLIIQRIVETPRAGPGRGTKDEAQGERGFVPGYVCIYGTWYMVYIWYIYIYIYTYHVYIPCIHICIYVCIYIYIYDYMYL